MDNKIFSASNWKKLVSEEREQRQNREFFFKIADPGKYEIWADIGCGPGFFTLPLAQKVTKVFAIDISNEMLGICKRRAEEQQLENIEYIKSEGVVISLEDNSVDDVLLVNVFHELQERSKVVKELNRILKLNGHAFIIDWKYEKMDFGPPLEHRVTIQEVTRDLATNGFTFVQSWDIYEIDYVLEFKKM
ncbi:putative methyltransferase YcgJ [bacterium BMS3Abin05]|nr:putative methyltransferase YcgJ [bacterium BMS3Abin05]HDZ13166.1 class I SAM-dependent methyltransferase [Bacteroidota bacterium]